jgi:hypothetical protein
MVLVSSWSPLAVRRVDDLTGSWNLISQRVRLWNFITRDDIDTKENENENLVSIRSRTTAERSMISRRKGFQKAIKSGCCEEAMHVASTDSVRGHHVPLPCRGKQE